MKRQFGISSVIVPMLLGSVWGFAGEVDQNPSLPPIAQLQRVSKITGAELRASDGEKLGKVADLAVDLQNGEVVEIIVATNKQFTAVPPQKFAWVPTSKSLQLTAGKDLFTSAARFDLNNWESTTEQASISEVYRYYGTPAYFIVPDDARTNRNGIQLGEIARAKKLLGSSVHNLGGQKIGKVEDILVDLKSGRIADVVLSSGAILGADGQLSALPPQSFRPGLEDGTLILDITKDALAHSPHLTGSEWLAMGGRSGVDNTAQNVADRSHDSLTPMKQGKSKSDVDTTRRIRREIIADKTFSTDAHNVKIITIDGRVTLRGPVATDDELRRIEAIAVSVATASNVDNQLKPKIPSATVVSQ